MSNIFVAKDGSDGNGGTSYADAFLTIGKAVSVAASGDKIKVGPGVYQENLVVAPGGSYSLTIEADGYVVMDGGIVGGYAFTVSNNQPTTVTFNDLIFKNYVVGVISLSTGVSTMNTVLNRCRFDNCTTGVYIAGGSGYQGILALGCLFANCGIGLDLEVSGPGSLTNKIFDCTFANNGIGFKHNNTGVFSLSHCVFGLNTSHMTIGNVSGVTEIDYNDVWFDGSASATWGGTTETVFANWQSTSGGDAHSIGVDPVFLDSAKGLYSLHVTSPALTDLVEITVGNGAGPQSLGLNGHIGFSKNDPDGNWANRILSGTVVNGGDNIELSGGSSGTARTGVIDLGSVRRIRRINPITTLDRNMYPTDVPDYDPADVQPKRMTFRWRGQAASFIDSDVSPAWNETEPSAFGVDINSAMRYLQVEVTLRNDGT